MYAQYTINIYILINIGKASLTRGDLGHLNYVARFIVSNNMLVLIANITERPDQK